MWQHNVLFICEENSKSSHIFSLVEEQIKSHLISSLSDTTQLSFGLFLASPQPGLRAKVRKVIKPGIKCGNAKEALQHLSNFQELAMEACSVDASYRVDLSNLLKGLAAEPWNDGHNRISIFFSNPPSTDVHSALQNLLQNNIYCEFIYLSQLEYAEETRERLAELAVFVSGYDNCSLRRVTANNPTQDLAGIKTSWFEWMYPPTMASLKLQERTLPVKLVPLIQNTLAASQSPQNIMICVCHELPVCTPPRCSVNGRKPKLHSAKGFAFGDTSIIAPETGVSTCILTPFSTIPENAFDCCIVIGSPTLIVGLSESSAEHLSSLSEELKRRQQFLVLRSTTKNTSSLHIMATSVTENNLVLLRVAGKEELLVYPYVEQFSPSSEGTKLASSLLDSLPSPSCYNPLAYSTGWLDHMSSSIQSSTISQKENDK